MLSFSSFVFSWRMRLLRLKKHKFVVSISIVFIISIIILGPPAYKESWLDPFSTLNVPNRVLHPHAINKLGMINSKDPFLPLSYTDEGKIRELMRNLQRSTPLSTSEQTLLALDGQKVIYFSLHRAPSSYHEEQDYALQYYPEEGIVFFGHQYFRLNEATINNFVQITSSMTKDDSNE